MSHPNADRDVRSATPRLHALDGLRVIFMITIFLSHCSYLSGSADAAVRSAFKDVFYNGVLGVGFFFLLSGFVTCLQDGERYDTLTAGGYGAFIRKKHRRVFPAYLVCLAAMFALKVRSGGVPYLLQNG